MSYAKIKIMLFVSMLILVFSLFVVGVLASSHNINLSGTIDFSVSDDLLYIKDIRYRTSSQEGDGDTIDNFLPGFVSYPIELVLGKVDAEEDFYYYIDVINTTANTYTVDTTSETNNANITASGVINGDAVSPSEINESTLASGTITIFVDILSAGTVSLDDVVIDINEAVVYSGFEFLISQEDNTASLVSYNGGSENVVIPSTFSIAGDQYIEGNDYTVTSIIDAESNTTGAFYQARSYLQGVELPSTITNIGDYAFRNCNLLSSVNIPEGTTRIGEYAFFNSNVTNITIPKSVITIERQAFNSSDLINVTFESGSQIETIGVGAFSWTSLEEINLEACTKLLTIGCSVFSNTNITDIYIPASVTSLFVDSIIGQSSLGTANYLTEIVVDANNQNYTSIDGILFDKNIQTLIQYPIGNTRTSYNIPSTVNLIIYSAFNGSRFLQNVNIPDSVTEIGSNAFSNCQALTSIDLPENLSEINNETFMGCTSLESVYITANATDFDAFANCTSLSNVVIKEGVTLLGVRMFANCTSLETITIPEGVEEIEYGAFYNCTALQTVSLPSTLTMIEGDRGFTYDNEGVFQGCTNLININLEECVNLTHIGAYAFYGTNLSSVNIPASVTRIERYAFGECESLTQIIFTQTENWRRTRNASVGAGSLTTGLDDASTAASYFTDQYVDYYWNVVL